MPMSTNYIFAASVSSLDISVPELLSHTFAGIAIPATHIVSPHEVSAQYEALEFYSNKPLTLGKQIPGGSLSTFKNAWSALSSSAAAKRSEPRGGNKAHRRYLSAHRKTAQSKDEIVRYELRPRLPFALEHRLWYPVEQAWQIYNYDKSFLSPTQIERLEDLKKERDHALYMMRGGYPSYWTMVRDAEIGMFGDSPEFGRRPKVGRATPLVGRRRWELFSYKARRGKSTRFRAADGFKRKGRRVHTSVKSLAQASEPAPSLWVYGRMLESIVEEDIPEPPARKPTRPSTRTNPVRNKLLVSSKSVCSPAVPSLVQAMPEPWDRTLQSTNPKNRPSIDSGFAESRSMKSAEAPSAPPIPSQVHSVAIQTLPRNNVVDPFQHQDRATFSQVQDSRRPPLYEVTLNTFQSAVYKADSIRRSSFDTLKRVCRVRPAKTAALIHQPGIEEDEGVPLFRPWTIGEQSIATYRNPRKWVSFVGSKLKGMMV
ncbi:hypothetical protein C7212DRAFT_364590 [Tuber magnatum]|uniref:Uncharacterized protein n=1 Tax=Tuber magnatum TaxID=42249 RepID=A0A317SNX1_9PEZI|nr:hypothetical protein C7212DRAFT_364590 [Tuber magnatum]